MGYLHKFNSKKSADVAVIIAEYKVTFRTAVNETNVSLLLVYNTVTAFTWVICTNLTQKNQRTLR